MREFVHLHVHSAYSLSEGAIKIGALRDLCLRHRMPAVAVTDTNNLFGALEIAETLSAAGVQPIAGLQQAFLTPSLHGTEARYRAMPGLVLLAQNETGFRNLMRLSSRAFLDSASDDEPCAALAWLDDMSEGVLCMTGGHQGPIDRLLRADRAEDAAHLLEKLMGVFGNRLYVELQRHPSREDAHIEPALIDFAYRLGLPVVASNEPFFPTPADFEAHDALLCIAQGAYVHQEDRRTVTPDHYFKSGGEMAALFADLPEAISMTLEIAQRCSFRPRTRTPILPRFVSSGGGQGDEIAELERQAREGLDRRLEAAAPAAELQVYRERLEFEVSIIARMGFAGYFLIVADFIKWAKQQGIPVGPGRGSGAGSLVAWALTITDLDPLRFGLLFERFLNPERVSMPDFDIDFCQDRRDEVIRYVQHKYGSDRVAQIITFGKLQARAVLRDVGRVLGMPFGQIDRLCKLVPNNPAQPVTLAEAIASEPKLQEERDRDDGVAALLEKALKLEGLYRHASTHAAGVVISDRPLHELTPLYRDARAAMPATQYNMKWVEPAGLVKFDFLGLKTLTVIEKAAAFVRAQGRAFSAQALPLDDPATFAMLAEGATVGVFQLESAGMRSTLRAMKPDSLEDIIALVSLYRPGPMENIPAYIERKQGLQEPDYLHPSLEVVLKETYGVIIYQEQVMQIARILSGYSLGEADLLRRAMGKKQKDEMDLQRKRFVEGALANGVSAGKASSIFDLVQKFAGYGFNKSHAAAYAYIAYQTAYLKANHAAAFLAASMSLDRANTDKLAIFLQEARRSGVTVRPPHVNNSQVDFSVEDGSVVYGLAAIKNVGEAGMMLIVAARGSGGPFHDLYDLAERVDLKAIGKRPFENLVRAGALDGLGATRAAALAAVDLLVRYSAQAREERDSAQAGLFDGVNAGASGLERPKLPAAEPWTPLEQLGAERQALGFYFSGHPLDDYERELRRLNAMTYVEVIEAARPERGSATIAAIVRGARFRRSKSGKPFAWVECSDASADFEVTVFSEVLAQSRDLFEAGVLVLMSVSTEDRDGDVRLTCEAVRRLDTAAAQTVSQLRISLASIEALGPLKRRLAAIKAPTASEAGSVVISLGLEDQGGRQVDIVLGEPAACTPSVRGALRALEGVSDVELI